MEESVSTSFETLFSSTARITDKRLCNAPTDVVCDTEGGRRRCGGQGDVLSGSIGTLLAWMHHGLRNEDLRFDPSSFPDTLFSQNRSTKKRSSISELLGCGEERMAASLEGLCASLVACHLVRCSAKKAFLKHKRSMLTPDMIAELGGVFEELFPVE